MTTRHDAMVALHGVIAEYNAARRAVSFLLALAERDSTLLRPHDPSFAALRACLQNLERTYLVRLFAVFEENLRDIWTSSFGKKTQPVAKNLIDGCSARRGISVPRVSSEVHEVRLFRNSVIHGTPAPSVPIAESKRRLCAFMAWMPEGW
jgi:hypothetical protein